MLNVLQTHLRLANLLKLRSFDILEPLLVLQCLSSRIEHRKRVAFIRLITFKALGRRYWYTTAVQTAVPYKMQSRVVCNGALVMEGRHEVSFNHSLIHHLGVPLDLLPDIQT